MFEVVFFLAGWEWRQSYDHLPPLHVCHANNAIAAKWSRNHPEDSWRHDAWWCAWNLREGRVENKTADWCERRLRTIIGDAAFVQGDLPCPFRVP